MKSLTSTLLLASAGWLWSGCASRPPASPPPHSAAQAPADADRDGEAADQAPDEPSLPKGTGNPASLAHYAAGLSYQAGGKESQAMQEFYLSVMADPGNEAEALDLTRQLLQQHQAEKAAGLLSKVCQRQDASATMLLWLARVDLLSGKTNAAAAVSRRAMERWPADLAGYQAQLEALGPAAKSADALKVVDRAARHIRRAPADLISLAALYADCLRGPDRTNSPARLRGVALLDSVAAMKLSSPTLRERLADTYTGLGEPKKASAIYARLAATSADTTVARDQLLMKIALNCMEAKDWTNAAARFQTVVHDDPVRFPLAWYYLGILAETDLTPDDAVARLAEAAADFEHALRWGQGPEMAYYRLALVRADMGFPDEALQVLKQSRERFPVSFQSLFYASMVNERIKDYDEAVRCLDQAASLARTNNPALLDRDFYFQFGAACERDHKYDRAAEYLQKCINLRADDAEALNYLGFMWADRGENLVKARAFIEKAVKLDPKNAAYLDSLGWVLYKLKLPREALPWMLRAVECSDEPDATILDHLGDVYLALGQTGKALENWKKSLAIESNDDVKKKLQLFDAGAT